MQKISTLVKSAALLSSIALTVIIGARCKRKRGSQSDNRRENFSVAYTALSIESNQESSELTRTVWLDAGRDYKQAKQWGEIVSNLVYHLTLKIVPGIYYEGSLRMNFVLKQQSFLRQKRPFEIAFRGRSLYYIRVNGVRFMEPTFDNGIIAFPNQLLKKGDNEVQLIFDNKFSLFDQGVVCLFDLNSNQVPLRLRQTFYISNGAQRNQSIFPVIAGVDSEIIFLTVIHQKGWLCLSNTLRRSLKLFDEQQLCKTPFFSKTLIDVAKCPLRKISKDIKLTQYNQLILSSFKIKGRVEKLGLFVGNSYTFKLPKKGEQLPLTFVIRKHQKDKKTVQERCKQLKRIILQTMTELQFIIPDIKKMSKLDVVLSTNSSLSVQVHEGLAFVNIAYLLDDLLPLQRQKLEQQFYYQFLRVFLIPAKPVLLSQIQAYKLLLRKFSSLMGIAILKQAHAFVKKMPNPSQEMRQIQVCSMGEYYRAVYLQVPLEQNPEFEVVKVTISQGKSSVDKSMNYLIFGEIVVRQYIQEKKNIQLISIQAIVPLASDGQLVTVLLTDSALAAISLKLNLLSDIQLGLCLRAVLYSSQMNSLTEESQGRIVVQVLKARLNREMAQVFVLSMYKYLKSGSSSVKDKIFKQSLRGQFKGCSLWANSWDFKQYLKTLLSLDYKYAMRRIGQLKNEELTPQIVNFLGDKNYQQSLALLNKYKDINQDIIIKHKNSIEAELSVRRAVVGNIQIKKTGKQHHSLLFSWLMLAHGNIMPSSEKAGQLQMYKEVRDFYQP